MLSTGISSYRVQTGWPYPTTSFHRLEVCISEVRMMAKNKHAIDTGLHWLWVYRTLSVSHVEWLWILTKIIIIITESLIILTTFYISTLQKTCGNLLESNSILHQFITKATWIWVPTVVWAMFLLSHGAPLADCFC